MTLAFLLTYAVASLVFLRPPLHSAGTPSATTAATVTSSHRENNDGYDHRWGRQPRIQSALGADSIVFIALGPAARSASLLYALSSLREEGQWDGAVHVIVEHEDDLDCLSTYLRQSVTAIAIAPPSSGGGADDGGDKPGGALVNNAKTAKMKLLDLLPPSVERVVYVDCDVVTQKPLGPFLDAVAQAWEELDRTAAANPAAAENGPLTARPSSRPADGQPSRLQGGRVTEGSTGGGGGGGDRDRPSTLMIFEDAGGHTVPVCWGCDRAHSGVVALARGHSERCLELWHDAFRGGGSGSGNKGTATDQEALDVALREGSGCRAHWIDRRHLSFMKDAFVMAGLTRRSTFGHFTGLLHPQGLGKAYRRFYEGALGRGFEEWGRGEIEACAAGL